MEKNIDKVYDLIERFNFNELPEEEKLFVLKHVSETEYNKLRSTLGDTVRYFSNYPEEIPSRPIPMLRQVLAYRIELYKIAAVFLIMLFAGILISKKIIPDQSDVLAMADTVYIENIDTVFIPYKETIEVVKEKIVYKEAEKSDELLFVNTSQHSKPEKPDDCSGRICPEDLEGINRLNFKNDFSKDRTLAEFTVALN